MTKTDKLNQLFEEWKKQKFLFCEDGIICESVYNAIDALRPLFILKDVHNETVACDELSEDGVNIDMRKAIFKPGQEKTWKHIAYWTEAFANSIPQKFEIIKNISVFDSLKKTAFLNIKKDEGGASVCGSVLLKYAKRDKDFLKEQISICTPDVIVTCGEDVFTCLEEIYSKEELTFVEKIEISYDSKYGEIYNLKINSDKTVFVIKYLHPNRTSHEKTYNDMLKFRDFIYNEFCNYEG